MSFTVVLKPAFSTCLTHSLQQPQVGVLYTVIAGRACRRRALTAVTIGSAANLARKSRRSIESLMVGLAVGSATGGLARAGGCWSGALRVGYPGWRVLSP